MSLATASLMDTVKKQYRFKLKAYIDAFSSLVGIQLIGILFSLGGSHSSGTFSEGLHFEMKYYSADIVIVFTMIWAFVTAITITTRPYRDQDFTFVTNRLSSSLSNILFLLTACVMGAVTAMLSRYLIQLVGTFFTEEQLFLSGALYGELVLGIIGSFLYIFCVASIGYFIGSLIQVNKIFTVVVPVLIIGSLFLDASMGNEPTIIKIFQVYMMEPSMLLFFIKILITSAIFFLASISILNRMEVRR